MYDCANLYSLVHLHQNVSSVNVDCQGAKVQIKTMEVNITTLTQKDHLVMATSPTVFISCFSFKLNESLRARDKNWMKSVLLLYTHRKSCQFSGIGVPELTCLHINFFHVLLYLCISECSPIPY